MDLGHLTMEHRGDSEQSARHPPPFSFLQFGPPLPRPPSFPPRPPRPAPVAAPVPRDYPSPLPFPKEKKPTSFTSFNTIHTGPTTSSSSRPLAAMKQEQVLTPKDRNLPAALTLQHKPRTRNFKSSNAPSPEKQKEPDLPPEGRSLPFPLPLPQKPPPRSFTTSHPMYPITQKEQVLHPEDRGLPSPLPLPQKPSSRSFSTSNPPSHSSEKEEPALPPEGRNLPSPLPLPQELGPNSAHRPSFTSFSPMPASPLSPKLEWEQEINHEQERKLEQKPEAVPEGRSISSEDTLPLPSFVPRTPKLIVTPGAARGSPSTPRGVQSSGSSQTVTRTSYTVTTPASYVFYEQMNVTPKPFNSSPTPIPHPISMPKPAAKNSMRKPGRKSFNKSKQRPHRAKKPTMPKRQISDHEKAALELARQTNPDQYYFPNDQDYFPSGGGPSIRPNYNNNRPSYINNNKPSYINNNKPSHVNNNKPQYTNNPSHNHNPVHNNQIPVYEGGFINHATNPFHHTPVTEIPAYTVTYTPSYTPSYTPVPVNSIGHTPHHKPTYQPSFTGYSPSPPSLFPRDTVATHHEPHQHTHPTPQMHPPGPTLSSQSSGPGLHLERVKDGRRPVRGSYSGTRG